MVARFHERYDPVKQELNSFLTQNQDNTQFYQFLQQVRAGQANLRPRIRGIVLDGAVRSHAAPPPRVRARARGRGGSASAEQPAEFKNSLARRAHPCRTSRSRSRSRSTRRVTSREARYSRLIEELQDLMNQIDTVDLEIATYERGQLDAGRSGADDRCRALWRRSRSKSTKSTRSGRSTASTGVTSSASIDSRSRPVRKVGACESTTRRLSSRSPRSRWCRPARRGAQSQQANQSRAAQRGTATSAGRASPAEASARASSSARRRADGEGVRSAGRRRARSCDTAKRRERAEEAAAARPVDRARRAAATQPRAACGRALGSLLDREVTVLQRLVREHDAQRPAARPDILLRLAETYFEMQQEANAPRPRARPADLRGVSAAEERGPRPASSRSQQRQGEQQLNRIREQAIRTLRDARPGPPELQAHGRGALLARVRARGDAAVRSREPGLPPAHQGLPAEPVHPERVPVFAEYYFNQGDMRAALQFYQKVTEFPPDTKPASTASRSTNRRGSTTTWRTSGTRYSKFVETIEFAQSAPGRARRGEPRDANRGSELVLPYAQVGSPHRALEFFRRYAANERASARDVRELAASSTSTRANGRTR